LLGDSCGEHRSDALWQRTLGSNDRCWEIRAFHAAGESAPAWYCLPD